MTRCYSWAEFSEHYSETEAEHRCDLCGGWIATCGCPPVIDTDMDLIHGALRLISEHREAS